MTAVAPNGFGYVALPWNPMPYMDEYLLELETSERSPDYIRKIKAGLSYFADFCQKRDIGHPEQVERNHLLHFQAWVNKQGWEKSYQIQIMKYVRGWFNWMEEVRYNTDNPWYRIRVGTKPKTPHPISDDDLEMLFARHRQDAFRLPPFHFHRREMILALLYNWGLRINELQALNVTGLDVRLDSVAARNKGGNLKHLPYGPEMKAVFLRWSSARAKHAKIGEDALIIDNNGNRLGIGGIRKIVVRLGQQVGLDIHPHMFRDTCGTTMLDGDGEVERIMKVLGHTRREQTLAYSALHDHKVAEMHERIMGPRLAHLFDNSQRDPEVPF